MVDDLAVKYVGKHHDDHLRNALLQNYELTTDWEGKLYSGMSLKWGYRKEHVTFLCLITCPMCSANSNMTPQNIRNTHHPNMLRQCMEQQPNI
jgi:hypothetical protein